MKIRTTRRISQVFFILLFLWFCAVTTLGDAWWQLRGWPVNWFLELDPLVGLTTLLTTGTLYAGLLWGVATIALTVLLGRFFCGWICPFGTLHQAVGWLGRRRKPACGAGPGKPTLALAGRQILDSNLPARGGRGRPAQITGRAAAERPLFHGNSGRPGHCGRTGSDDRPPTGQTLADGVCDTCRPLVCSRFFRRGFAMAVGIASDRVARSAAAAAPLSQPGLTAPGGRICRRLDRKQPFLRLVPG